MLSCAPGAESMIHARSSWSLGCNSFGAWAMYSSTVFTGSMTGLYHGLHILESQFELVLTYTHSCSELHARHRHKGLLQSVEIKRLYMWQNYLQPKTLEEALLLLRDHPEARIVAGGTDVLVELQRGIKPTNTLID